MPKVCRLNADRLDIAVFAAITGSILLACSAPEMVLRITPSCLITMVTGHHCWGCGMTHALIALAHGNLDSAWQYNPRALMVMPLLGIAYFQLLARILRGFHSSNVRRSSHHTRTGERA